MKDGQLLFLSMDTAGKYPDIVSFWRARPRLDRHGVFKFHVYDPIRRINVEFWNLIRADLSIKPGDCFSIIRCGNEVKIYEWYYKEGR